MRKRKDEDKKLKENTKPVIKKEVYPDPYEKGDDLKTPFQQFLKEHTVKLPEANTNQFKLLKNMQAKNYFEVNAKELGLENIVLMNEERRRHRKLPPLTPLDYNCIDKAASKIKTVLDTLSIIRKVNGKAMVKRNMKEHLKSQTPLRTLEKACKISSCFGSDLVITWKAAIVYPDKFNKDQLLIQKSLAIKEEQAHDEIKEVDSEHEETDPNLTERESTERDMNSLAKEIEQEHEDKKEISIAKHVGSVEEFSPKKLLIEQGQVKLAEYDFFCNVYFRQYKLDHIENYKDFRKLLEFDVISKNTKLYRGKDFPSDYIQQLQRSKKELTEYISYCEIEIMSRNSLSNWRDSVHISWEKLSNFFSLFCIKFNPITFIRSRRFSPTERYIFFNYISNCMKIENSSVEMDLGMIDLPSIYDYLHLHKESYAYHFFFYNGIFPDDYQYEDMQYSPFTESVPTFLSTFEYTPQKEHTPNTKREMGLAFSLEQEEKEKYNIKIPGEIDDPLLKLDLKVMKPATGVFLGRLKIGKGQEYYNVRIDFYKRGTKPILEVKVCNRNCSVKIMDEKIILRVIKLCNMSSTKFIKNQIKSLVTVKRKLSGEFCDLLLNKNIREYNHKKQDYLNLMLCNEILLRRNIKPKTQFQSIIRQENFGRVLASVTEFYIDTEVIDRYNQFSHLYGNKHLDEKTKATIAKQNKNGGKYFEKIRYWKINMHVLSKCEQYNTIVSYKDLKYYYETQVFEFFENNPNIPTPNLIELLSEYLKYMFVYRKQLGTQVFWRFPIYRKPLEMGEEKVVSTNQLQVNKIYEMIKFYQKLQDRIDEFNELIATEENIPLSLNREKKKKVKKSPPMLSLRPKYIIETSLPLFDDLNVLTVASTEQEIVLQKAKYLGKVMCLISITLHRSLECWVWTIYCPQNNRTFSVNFYSSDLYKLPEKLFNDESFDGEDANKKLWGILIDLCYIDHNSSGDIIFTLSNFKSPLKEVMYQNYLYSEQGEDIYFMEITMKTTQNYVTEIDKAFPPLDNEQVKDYTVNLRAYSITRNIWIKDYQPLRTLLSALQKEKFFSKNTLLVYYNMIRDACVLLAYRVRFSDNAKTREVKKQRIDLDIRKLLGPKKHIPLEEQEILKKGEDDEIEVDLVKFKNERERRAKEKEEGDPYGQKLLPGGERGGLKDSIKREVDLSRILYQMVISLSPMQTATVLYNDIGDTFLYRIYRPGDGSVFEKTYTGDHIKIHCHPVYKSCISQGKQQEVGQRLLSHYMDEMLIESTLEFNDIR